MEVEAVVVEAVVVEAAVVEAVVVEEVRGNCCELFQLSLIRNVFTTVAFYGWLFLLL